MSDIFEFEQNPLPLLFAAKKMGMTLAYRV